MNKSFNSIIFDLGNVLIDWNPRYVYSRIFDSEEKWTGSLIPFAPMPGMKTRMPEGLCTKLRRNWSYSFRSMKKEVRAYYGRWEEMLGGPIQGTVDILHSLKDQQYKLYALTNWSAETFPVALQRYDFLQWFNGIVMSGEEKTRKPFPEIYRILLDRFSVDPSQAVFIDDNLRNIEGAEAVGIYGIHFQSSQQLRLALQELGIIN